MNKCLECGAVFEDDEIAHWVERHGFDDGLYEKWSGCPYCYGAYEEVEECEDCGEAFSPGDLYNGYCAKCVKDKLYTYIHGKWFLQDSGNFDRFMDDVFDGGGLTRFNELVDSNGFDWMAAQMKDWIFDDEDWGCENFSDWLRLKDLL